MNKTLKTLKVGDTFTTNEGCIATVIRIRGSIDIDVTFNDDWSYVRNVRLDSLNRGAVKNPYHPSVYGLGYMGVGDYRPYLNRVRCKAYTVWLNMLKRSYYTKYAYYADSTVCKEWLSYQVFAEWYYNHPYCIEGYQLNKNIPDANNRVYSPETCTLVPQQVGNLFRKDCFLESSDSGVGTGINFTYNRYVVHIGSTEVGRYRTLELAVSARALYRAEYILALANKFKEVMAPEVYEAMSLLAFQPYDELAD